MSTYSPLQAPPWQCGLQVHTLHPLQDGCRRWDAHSAVGTAHGVGGAHTGQLLAVPTPPTAAPIPLLTAAKQPGFFYASFQADTFFLKSSSYFLILPMIVSGKFWHCYLALSITRFLPERLQAFYSPTQCSQSCIITVVTWAMLPRGHAQLPMQAPPELRREVSPISLPLGSDIESQHIFTSHVCIPPLQVPRLL